MKTTFDPLKLHRALVVRGLSLTDLAEAGPLSRTTASSAVNGKPVTLVTATRIARVLANRRPIPALDDLVALALTPDAESVTTAA